MTTFYVAATGNDSTGNGSAALPWREISKAAAAVSAGDTVLVGPGTYGALSFTVNGTPTARITFLSTQKWGAHVTGIFQPRGDYNTVQDFEVTNSAGSQGVETYGAGAWIIGNKIHAIPGGCPTFGGAGIHIYHNGLATPTNCIAERNVVYDIGNNSGVACYLTHGIYIEGVGDTIRNNIVFNAQGYGIHAWHAANNVTIVNNTVFANLAGGILNGAGDADATLNNNCFVANNLVYANGTLGGRWGISEDGSTGPANVYTNNLVYANQPTEYHLQNSISAIDTVSAAPLFVTYTGTITGDYHLQVSSPAIDAGTIINAPAIDLDGNPRPLGNGVDIGAYEFAPQRRDNRGRHKAPSVRRRASKSTI